MAAGKRARQCIASLHRMTVRAIAHMHMHAPVHTQQASALVSPGDAVESCIDSTSLQRSSLHLNELMSGTDTGSGPFGDRVQRPCREKVTGNRCRGMGGESSPKPLQTALHSMYVLHSSAALNTSNFLLVTSVHLCRKVTPACCPISHLCLLSQHIGIARSAQTGWKHCNMQSSIFENQNICTQMFDKQ